MTTFYVWMGILIDSYEKIISDDLLSLGYQIAPADNTLNQDRLLAYKLTHATQTIKEVESDINLIINKNKLHCHSCVIITPYSGGFDSRWFGSNISFPPSDGNKEPIKPPVKPFDDKGQEIDDVVVHMHRIIDAQNSAIREKRNQCLNQR